MPEMYQVTKPNNWEDGMDMNNREIVQTLNLLTKDGLARITPDFLEVKLDTHSTATHCHIHLIQEGLKPLLVWYKTNWHSSGYEFNEKNKIIGIQADCKFIEPSLVEFFVCAKKELNKIESERLNREFLNDANKTSEKQSFIGSHRNAFENSLNITQAK